MEILILAALILLNGLFAMSEIALVTARRARLQALVDGGDAGAAAAMALNEHPTRFLSTIQVGITLITLLQGVVSNATFAAPLTDWIVEHSTMKAEMAGYVASGLVLLVTTFVSIVIGELVPKRIGQLTPEKIARVVARPIRGLAAIAHPFVRLLSASTEVLLRLLGARTTADTAVTEEEIHAMIEEGSESGVIDEQERAMVRNVFRLDDRQSASLMTPRSDIVYLDLDDGIDENLKKVVDSDHARFPVCRSGLREVMGVVSARQLLKQAVQGEKMSLDTAQQPAVFVPESLTGMELLENFRATSSHVALVVDEYGEVQGLVTPQDLFEAIAGEFKTPSPEDAWAVQRKDGSWLLDGLIPVPELKDRLELERVPEEDYGRYNTLSGMLMLLLGRVPHTADVAEGEGWRFEIVDMDPQRSDKVLATRVAAAVR
ncbi:MAG: hemolysin family protein, partial [Betaproteobacteria bacterium]